MGAAEENGEDVASYIWICVSEGDNDSLDLQQRQEC